MKCVGVARVKKIILEIFTKRIFAEAAVLIAVNRSSTFRRVDELSYAFGRARKFVHFKTRFEV